MPTPVMDLEFGHQYIIWALKMRGTGGAWASAPLAGSATEHIQNEECK